MVFKEIGKDKELNNQSLKNFKIFSLDMRDYEEINKVFKMFMANEMNCFQPDFSEIYLLSLHKIGFQRNLLDTKEKLS
jgi:hypothetical protein